MKKEEWKHTTTRPQKEAVEKALSFLPSGAVVAHGGSMTLEETGMMDALRSADIEFLDRAVCKTPEDSRKIFHDALMADYYFMSTNAMTIDGELVNIDGNGNRVAALIYGPEKCHYSCRNEQGCKGRCRSC